MAAALYPVCKYEEIKSGDIPEREYPLLYLRGKGGVLADDVERISLHFLTGLLYNRSDGCSRRM